MGNTIIVSKNGVEYLQFKKLLEYSQIKHGITLRTNDLDFGSIDNLEENKEKITDNYKQLCTAMEIDYNKIIRPRQTHTDVIKTINKEPREIELFPQYLDNVDGLITNKSNIILSLSFADCIPLIFYDPIKNVIANIHSGWQGTLKKIGQKAVLKMIEEYDSNPKDIICCIGPSIKKCCFEVQEDVKELFYNTFSYTNKTNEFILDKTIDTVKINETILQDVGLDKENIIDCRNLHSL